MTKKFILNIVLNLGIIFLILSGVSAYQSGHALFMGLSIALLVVMIYLKVVLLKQVNREARIKYEEKLKEEQRTKKNKRS